MGRPVGRGCSQVVERGDNYRSPSLKMQTFIRSRRPWLQLAHVCVCESQARASSTEERNCCGGRHRRGHDSVYNSFFFCQICSVALALALALVCCFFSCRPCLDFVVCPFVLQPCDVPGRALPPPLLGTHHVSTRPPTRKQAIARQELKKVIGTYLAFLSRHQVFFVYTRKSPGTRYPARQQQQQQTMYSKQRTHPLSEESKQIIYQIQN